MKQQLSVNGRSEQMRILVTASREWRNDSPTREMFRRALLDEFEHVAGYVELDEVTVVHGAQGVYDKTGVLISGGDMISDEVAEELGMCTDPIPADWNGPCDVTCHHGPRRRRRDGSSYCQMAGLRRNAALIATQPDVCLGFPHPSHPSRGTRHCMSLATAAGITTYDRSNLLMA